MNSHFKNNLKEQLKNEEIIENNNRDDNISELEEDNESKLTQQEQMQIVITNDVKEKVISYVRIDEAIRKKNEEIKNLKKMRKPCEEILIKFLEGAQQDFMDLGDTDGKIIRTERKHKAPLKIGIIKEAIKEHLIAENMIDDEERCNSILNDIAKLIDNKRPMTNKVSIRRAVPKQKKQKA